MHPGRDIFHTNGQSDGQSTIPDAPNTFTRQSAGINDAPWDRLLGPCTQLQKLWTPLFFCVSLMMYEFFPSTMIFLYACTFSISSVDVHSNASYHPYFPYRVQYTTTPLFADFPPLLINCSWSIYEWVRIAALRETHRNNTSLWYIIMRHSSQNLSVCVILLDTEYLKVNKIHMRCEARVKLAVAQYLVSKLFREANCGIFQVFVGIHSENRHYR